MCALTSAVFRDSIESDRSLLPSDGDQALQGTDRSSAGDVDHSGAGNVDRSSAGAHSGRPLGIRSVRMLPRRRVFVTSDLSQVLELMTLRTGHFTDFA